MSKNEVYSYVIEKKTPKDAKQPLFIPYSGYFPNKAEALKWYENHGKWLSKTFNRTLVLKNELENRFLERQKNAIKKEKERESKKLLKTKEDAK